MSRRFLRATLLFLISATIVRAEPETDFRVGGIYGLTGPLADFGEEFSRGAQLYIRTKSIPPRRFELLIEDGKFDSMAALSAFKKLAEQHKVRAVHVQGSGPNLAIKPLSEARGIILLASAAHPDLLPGSSLVIRHGNLTSEDAETLADFVLHDLPAGARLASIYIQNDWGESYQNAFTARLEETSPAPAHISAAHLPSETDFRPLLLRLIRTSPAALVVNSFGISIASIVEQARQLGFHGKVYINNGLALSKPAAARLRGMKDQGLYWQTYPACPSEFSETFRQYFGSDPGYYSLISFTDLELLDHAVEKAGPDPRAMVNYIRKLGKYRGRYLELAISPQGDILIPLIVEKFS